MNVLIRDAFLIPGDGGAPRPDTDVRVEAARIAEIGSGLAVLPSDRLVVEARGRVLMPAFVDAHTHALWAGDRLDEFSQRLAGKSYVEILKAGGGILSTVRAVRAASEAELAEGLAERLERMLREGSATVEVKSGYGLSTEHELKMLRAIAIAAQRFSGTVVPTALLGHALDPEQPNFVERVISETLPAVHEEFPGIFVDAFCEEGAWSLADCARLLRRAAELGHPCRLHADQFQRLGALELSVELGLVSVDHLEASTPSDLERLARSSTFGVVLPVSGLHLDGRYANVRPFLDAGGRLVLASNCNPGSAPSFRRTRLIQTRRYWRSSRYSGPQTLVSSSVWSTTLPAFVARCWSSSHSVRDSWTSCPSRVTIRRSRSISTSSKATTPEPEEVPEARRMTARTRAASSSGWNGLAT